MPHADAVLHASSFTKRSYGSEPVRPRPDGFGEPTVVFVGQGVAWTWKDYRGAAADVIEAM